MKTKDNGEKSSLRDRIAAAIYSVTNFGGVPWEDLPFDQYRDEYRAQADAVIEELGLYRDGHESRTVMDEMGVTYRIEGGHRYVTAWKADNE